VSVFVRIRMLAFVGADVLDLGHCRGKFCVVRHELCGCCVSIGSSFEHHSASIGATAEWMRSPYISSTAISNIAQTRVLA
jgi:hypothetical protein